ncbi:MAG TPA: IS4 family transposase [Anaerolineales bacterium]|nr:IS4 family transposase [Anaerolineales bacterium]
MQNWAVAELETVKFGDRRLKYRLMRIVERMVERPALSIPAACKNWAETKATYRFLSSDKVEAEAIRAAHREKTMERLQGETGILVAQDTTELNYSSHKKKEGLGGLRHPGERGLYVHSGLAIRLDGVPLGLLYQEVWARSIRSERSKEERHATSTKEKESQRWINTLAACREHIPENIQTILVADREADMYDLFAAPRSSQLHLLVRAVQNRRIDHPATYLKQAVSELGIAGQMSVEVGRQGERAPRTAHLEIRYLNVEILPPHRGLYRKGAQPISVWVILAQESSPPAGEEPISWWLLTTLSIRTLEEAQRCIRWYSYRWLIERYHFVLKSGCRIERLQLENAQRLERAIATYAIVAWRLLWLTYQARLAPEQSCAIALETFEWQSLCCTVLRSATPPQQPPSLQLAILYIAKLGGFLARKGDGPPGVQTIWRGLNRLSDIAATWRLLHPSDVGNG